MIRKHIVLLSFCAGFSLTAAAQTGPHTPGNPSPAPIVRQSPKNYHEVITDKAVTTHGLFTIHRLDDKVFVELPDSLLGRDILLVSRLARAGAEMRASGSMTGYAGDILNQAVIRLEKGPSNRIFLREVSYTERSADSTHPMFRSVANSNIQPIAFSFDVRAYHKDSLTGLSSTVMDWTDLLNGDNDLFFFGPMKSKMGMGGYQPDKSYLSDIKTYPVNTEFRTVKTYSKAANSASLNNGVLTMGQGMNRNATVELNTSLLLLPAVPMRPRYADDRVGYFSSGYTDFDASSQRTKRTYMIERFRLEPSEKDMDKYLRGELVEPKVPIVIYIDPTTPSQWVPYLIQGINDWQAAFERAGFKHAITGRMAPTHDQDSSWSLDDARHSAIVYKPSSVPNASGPHVTDPRSGEVLETHINWYHNVMKLVHDWYFVQTAAVDPRARHMQFDDSLMGQLIRFVVSHEVGHTLGLMHNFGASAATPVEKLRDKAWVEAHGHTASIMDYARFNYVAQPEDSIGESGLFPRIGDYDKWAIEWGYRLVPGAMNPEAERPALNQWIIAHAGDPRYWFGNEDDPDDPRSQREDLGDNAMKAGLYGIKNLRRILAHLPEWTREPNSDDENLLHMYKQLNEQLSLYIGHVAKNIGGRYENLKSVEQAGPVYTLVPASTQQQALAFLDAQVFQTPEWILDPTVLSRIGVSPLTIVGSLQGDALSRLVSTTTLGKLVAATAMDPHAYGLSDLLTGLRRSIWKELDTHQPISVYRRNLQAGYLERLLVIVRPFTGGGGLSQAAHTEENADVTAAVKAELRTLKRQIAAALPVMQDKMSHDHLEDMLERIAAVNAPGR